MVLVAVGWACSGVGGSALCSARSKAADSLSSPGLRAGTVCFFLGSLDPHPAPSLTFCTLRGCLEATQGTLPGAAWCWG